MNPSRYPSTVAAGSPHPVAALARPAADSRRWRGDRRDGRCHTGRGDPGLGAARQLGGPAAVRRAVCRAEPAPAPIVVLSIGAGVLSGRPSGPGRSCWGALAGAAIGFGLSRSLRRSTVEQFGGERLARLDGLLRRRGLLTVIAVLCSRAHRGRHRRLPAGHWAPRSGRRKHHPADRPADDLRTGRRLWAGVRGRGAPRSQSCLERHAAHSLHREGSAVPSVSGSHPGQHSNKPLTCADAVAWTQACPVAFLRIRRSGSRFRVQAASQLRNPS